MPAPACQRVGVLANGLALAELALQWPRVDGRQVAKTRARRDVAPVEGNDFS